MKRAACSTSWKTSGEQDHPPSPARSGHSPEATSQKPPRGSKRPFGCMATTTSAPSRAALLEAWLAERREDMDAAAAAYRRTLERSERAGFADHAAFALSGLGSIALASGDLREAEELQRQALATADAADATWVAAHARVQLGRIAAATGDAATAERLYRQVLEWSQAERPRQARESLFPALAGSPATAAELGLTVLGETAIA
jgi:tetratricopeptide (TPR) repeat protein